MCNQHFNRNNDRICKKQVLLGGKRFREMTDAEALHRVKVWLVVGLHMVPPRNQQKHHVGIQPRDLDLDDYPEEELDAMVAHLPQGPRVPHA